MARCKLFSIEEIDRLVEEAGRDHLFFIESDGSGGWRPPEGYVDRYGAAKIFGVAGRTIAKVDRQPDHLRPMARIPVDEASVRGCGGRRVTRSMSCAVSQRNSAGLESHIPIRKIRASCVPIMNGARRGLRRLSTRPTCR